jgi:hypothetical protein
MWEFLRNKQKSIAETYHTRSIALIRGLSQIDSRHFPLPCHGTRYKLCLAATCSSFKNAGQ